MTSASFKQRVGMLLMPKIDRAHKNFLTTRNLTGNAFREDISWHFDFQQSSMIFIGRHVGGHTLAPQYGGQNYFLLISC